MPSSTTAAALPTTPSLEDQEVRRLCESGDLTQVAGSQSLLSQELLEQSQQSQSQESTEDVDLTQDDCTAGNADDDDTGDQKTLSAHAVTAAQRYGILTQDCSDDDDDDDDCSDDNENQENAPANSQGPASARSTSSKGMSTKEQTNRHARSHPDATVTSIGSIIKENSASSTSVLLPLPLSLSFPMSLSPQKDRGTCNDATGTGEGVPYDYDDTMDLVMELDEAFTCLDAIKQAATVQKRGKKRGMMNENTNTNSNSGQTTQNVLGSLLDAVQLVQTQSTMSPRCSPRLQKQQQQQEHSMDPHMTTTGNMLFPLALPGVLARVEAGNAAAASNKKRKSQSQQGQKKEDPTSSNNKRTMKHPILNSLEQQPQSPPPSKRQVVAQRAAALAVRVSSDAELVKRLLLSMAVLRDNPRQSQVPLPSPPAGHFLEDGFFWAHYPPLEQILKDNMARYYALSIGKCQSPEQHIFNNTLVALVRQSVTAREWSFDRIFMCDKVLRDRIRCYYKTHIQNAKKRLNTMLKNPTKKANASHLIQHWELIRETIVTSKQAQITSMQLNSSTSTGTSNIASLSSDSNSERKATKRAAARRVTMEEAAMDNKAAPVMEKIAIAEDIAWGARQHDRASKQQRQMKSTSYSATATSNSDSGSINNGETKVIEKAAARRVTMEEAEIAEDVASGSFRMHGLLWSA